MAAKKTGLGRGLDSLFSDSAILQTPAPVNAAENSPAKESILADNAERVIYIDINNIKPNVAQPRKIFKEEALQELASSIKTHGVIQPILVRPYKNGFELVAGERRWRAARIAGLKEIPAIVRQLDERTNTFYALIENMQREDLNAIEEAEGIKEIIEKYNLSQEEAAKLIGKSAPYISNSLRVLRLPEEVRSLVSEGRLSLGHAKALTSLDNEKIQISVAKKAADESWSVRQIENYTSSNSNKEKKSVKGKNKKDKSAEKIELEDSLSKALSTKVTIEGSSKKGKLIIEYFSEEELERILEIIKR